MALLFYWYNVGANLVFAHNKQVEHKIRPYKKNNIITIRELEENNIRISRRTFVRFQGVMAGA